MSRDITVYKTPALDLPLDELITRLQDKFGSEGTLDGLVRSTVAREVEKELNVNRKVFRDILLHNWETFFPGVSVLDVDLDTELDDFIAEKRPELTAILHNYIMKRAVVAGTPSLNLLLSTEVVQRTFEFPCNGKPHDFVDWRSECYSSFIVTESGSTHYENNVIRKLRTYFRNKFQDGKAHPYSCGNRKMRRKVTVSAHQCNNCKTIRSPRRASFVAYCESCGYGIPVRKIWRPLASIYVQQILLLNGLTVCN